MDLYDKGYSAAAWHDRAWVKAGLDMNYFEARYYDPVPGGWHAPDPMEQCHSPYVGLVNDPAAQFLSTAERRIRNASPELFGANYIDPDGSMDRHMLCGTAANDAQAFTTTLNIASTFTQTFGAFGGVVSFVSRSASVFAVGRMFKTLGDLMNGGFNSSINAGQFCFVPLRQGSSRSGFL